jgi:hypothetical protein
MRFGLATAPPDADGVADGLSTERLHGAGV